MKSKGVEFESQAKNTCNAKKEGKVTIRNNHCSQKNKDKNQKKDHNKLMRSKKTHNCGACISWKYIYRTKY